MGRPSKQLNGVDGSDAMLRPGVKDIFCHVKAVYVRTCLFKLLRHSKDLHVKFCCGCCEEDYSSC
jgi:hypothetical protein